MAGHTRFFINWNPTEPKIHVLDIARYSSTKADKTGTRYSRG